FNSNSTQTWVTESSLSLIGYNINCTSIKLSNYKNTVLVLWSINDQLKIMGGLLPKTYNLAHFHFHWGSDSSRGSEHTINGKAYPLEMHFLHYKESYSSFEEAQKFKDGLAVLAVLFKVTPHNNTALDFITNSLENLKQPYSEVVSHHKMPLLNILPKNLNSFYRYYGSLTTPNCDQAMWTVFTDTVAISEQQLSMFRKLIDDHGNYLQNNFRPTQPANGRKVYLVNIQMP
ncbi:unnamed protein product, partial [Meganyctiphanes norvegica]